MPARPTRGRGDPGNWTSSKGIEDCVRVLQNSVLDTETGANKKTVNMAQAERYAFVVENFDHHSSMNWRYQFFYYLDTKEIEMVGQCPTNHSPVPPLEDLATPVLYPQRDAALCSPLVSLCWIPVTLTLANLFFLLLDFFFFSFAVRYQEQEDLPEALPLRQHREGHAVHRGEDSGVL